MMHNRRVVCSGVLLLGLSLGDAHSARAETNPAHWDEWVEPLRSSTVSSTSVVLDIEGDLELGGSIFYGGDRLLSAFGTDSSNVALGIDALSAMPQSFEGNLAVGHGALATHTLGGSNNTVVGWGAVPDSMGGIDNVAIGAGALSSTTQSSYNVAVGAYALESTEIGSWNTAVGAFALRNTTGDHNIGVGLRAGQNATTGSWNIFIGSQGDAGDANALEIGFPASSATYIYGIAGSTVSDLPVLVNSAGVLGTTTSSRRFKEDIEDIAERSEALFDLRPVTFRYTEEHAGEGDRPIEYGLIAEEVAEIFPELVVRARDRDPETGERIGEPQPYAIRYHQLVPLLLNEIQRQGREIERRWRLLRQLQ